MAVIKKHATSNNVVDIGDGVYAEQVNYGASGGGIRSVTDVIVRHMEDYNAKFIPNRLYNSTLGQSGRTFTVPANSYATINGRWIKVSSDETEEVTNSPGTYIVYLTATNASSDEENRNPNTDTVSLEHVAVGSYVDSQLNLPVAKVVVGASDYESHVDLHADGTGLMRVDSLRAFGGSDIHIYAGDFPQDSLVAEFRTDKFMTASNIDVEIGGDLIFDSVTISAIQTSAESFVDNDTSLMTSAAILDKIREQVETEDELSELNDVNLTSSSTGDLLMYDGSNWVNTTTIDSASLILDYQDNSATANPVFTIRRDKTTTGNTDDYYGILRFDGAGLNGSNLTFGEIASQNRSSWSGDGGYSGKMIFRLKIHDSATLTDMIVLDGGDYGNEEKITMSADLDITGNITVSGNVDGVDLGSFKTTYDTHAADTAIHHDIYELTDDLAENEITQIQNINTTTISSFQWQYLGDLNQALTQSSAPTFTGLTLSYDNSGSSGNPTFTLFRDSSSPADGDDIGEIRFDGIDNLGNQITYSKIEGEIVDVTNGTEDGRLIFSAITNGVQEEKFRIEYSGIKVKDDIQMEGQVTFYDSQNSQYRNLSDSLGFTETFEVECELQTAYNQWNVEGNQDSFTYSSGSGIKYIYFSFRAPRYRDGRPLYIDAVKIRVLDTNLSSAYLDEIEVWGTNSSGSGTEIATTSVSNGHGTGDKTFDLNAILGTSYQNYRIGVKAERPSAVLGGTIEIMTPRVLLRYGT